VSFRAEHADKRGSSPTRYTTTDLQIHLRLVESSAMTSGAVASGLPLISALRNTATCEKGSWMPVKSPRSVIIR
jgi:hypothetical protein